MTYAEVAAAIELFQRNLAVFSFVAPPESGLQKLINKVQDFFESRNLLSSDELVAYWDEEFRELYDGLFTVNRLVTAVNELSHLPEGTMRSKLAEVFSGDLVDDADPSHGKRTFYELWLASHLAAAGFEVELVEPPDIRVKSKDACVEFCIACKFPSSWDTIDRHFSKGLEQIRRANLPGFVAMGMDELVFQNWKEASRGFTDFRRTAGEPLAVMHSSMFPRCEDVVVNRVTRAPDEEPIHAAVFSLTRGGIIGDPAQLVDVTNVELFGRQGDPLLPLMLMVAEALRQLR